MKKKSILYFAPQSEWSILDNMELICDSYSSGIDDFDYEEVDWTVTP